MSSHSTADPAVRRAAVLLVDDDPAFRDLAGRILSSRYRVESCATAEKALELAKHRFFDIVLADLYFDEVETELDGFDLIRAFHERDPDLPILMLSRATDPLDISRGLSLGAFHFVSKAFELEEIANLIQKAIESKQMEAQLRLHSFLPTMRAGELIYRCEEMQEVVARAEALAKLRDPILITGESGTGKDLLAAHIHNKSRPGRPFFAVNISARSGTLFEDEIFGHEAGAFTDARQSRKGILESAEGGTVFFDEIAALSVERQAALLRLIEDRRVRRLGSDVEKEVDVRFLLATNEDLFELQRQGRFREDLFHRIAQHRIHLPPLRARGGDVVFIAEAFLKSLPEPGYSLDAGAREFLLSYSWPGNVRRLQGLLRSVCATRPPGVLRRADLEAELSYPPYFPAQDEPGSEKDTLAGLPADQHRFLGQPLKSLLPYHVGKSAIEWAFRRKCIEYAQSMEPQTVRHQFKLLGVSHETYYNWLRELGYDTAGENGAGETDGDV